MERLLLTQEEARNIIGVGERNFLLLGIPYIQIGKRRKYRMEDIKEWLEKSVKGEKPCPLKKEKGRRTSGTTSPSKVIGFAEALKRTGATLPRALKQNGDLRR